MKYALTADEEKYRFAADNPIKLHIIETLLEKHPDENMLIIGMYLDQLEHRGALRRAADHRADPGARARKAL